MDKKVSVHISIGDNQFSCSVDELVDMFFDRFIDKLVESPKKSKYLEAVLKPQLEKDDYATTLTYKLVLSSRGVEPRTFENIIVDTYIKLTKEGFIEGNRKDYHTIFSIEEPLSRQVKWVGNMNELKYLVCKLSGKEFKEKINGVEKISLEKTDTTVFLNNKLIFKKAANSFLPKKGTTISDRGVDNPRTHTFLSDDKKEILNKIAKKFIKV